MSFIRLLLCTLHPAIRVLSTATVAYLLGYFLIAGLPSFGSSFLGISSANEAIVERATAEYDPPSGFIDAIYRIYTGNMGNSLNKRPVFDEISDAAYSSTPIILVLVLSLLLSASIGAGFGATNNNGILKVSRFLSFLPAYLPAYIAAGILPLLGINAARNEPLSIFALAIIAAIVPCAVIAGTICANVQECRSSEYFFTLKANGFSASEQFILITPTITRQLLPILPSFVTSALMAIFFVEAVFGYPGVGNSLIQALRRTDINLILSYVGIFALVHSVLSEFSRAKSPAEPSK